MVYLLYFYHSLDDSSLFYESFLIKGCFGFESLDKYKLKEILPFITDNIYSVCNIQIIRIKKVSSQFLKISV